MKLNHKFKKHKKLKEFEGMSLSVQKAIIQVWDNHNLNKIYKMSHKCQKRTISKISQLMILMI